MRLTAIRLSNEVEMSSQSAVTWNCCSVASEIVDLLCSLGVLESTDVADALFPSARTHCRLHPCARHLRPTCYVSSPASPVRNSAVSPALELIRYPSSRGDNRPSWKYQLPLKRGGRLIVQKPNVNN